jgi:hypothetical protein
MNFTILIAKGAEKSQADYVIQMQVRQQNVNSSCGSEKRRPKPQDA